MALSPIEMFRSNESSLAQILQGGSQTISGIMDKAIQIGRDMSNNATKNESDLLSMRQNETALAQRRAEGLTRSIADTQKFARGAFENDRSFVANEEQRDIQNNRASVNDLFSQQMQEKNYGLSAAAGDRANRALTGQEKDRETERLRLETERTNLENLYGPDQATSEIQGPPKPISYENIADQRKAEGYPEATRATPVETIFPSTPTTEGLSPVKEKAARAILTDPQASAGDRSRAARMLGIGAKGDDVDEVKPVTEAEKRAAQDQENQLADRDIKQVDEEIESNLASFPSQEIAEVKAYGSADKVPAEKLALAKIWDKNRGPSERAAAKKMTLPQYLAKGPQTPEDIAARTAVWLRVNGEQPQATSSTRSRKFNPATGKIE